MTITVKRYCLVAALALSASLPPWSFGSDAAHAASGQEPIEVLFEIESDSAERIKYAGQLRTYTQQVAAASCAITSNVSADEAYDILVSATSRFDRYLHALTYGDEELGIYAPETKTSIIDGLKEVEAEWKLVHDAIDKVLANGKDVESAHFIDDHNLRLLELTDKLSAEIKWSHANPFEISAADAMTMEIAGRQRMLTQKMAKRACEIWTGYRADEAKVALATLMQKFEASLRALRFGLTEAGIAPAPNDIIRADLDGLLVRWEGIKANQEALLHGQPLDLAQKVQIFHELQLELADLEHLLKDYRDHAERAHKGL
ncbi:MAG: type IV pili methyl-accepting chemotaxis transducer N-terminal domain-containing protein [Pseudomonadota bacterium]